MLKMFVSDVVVVLLGAGVAGLSAIATAHSLGCKVSMGGCGRHHMKENITFPSLDVYFVYFVYVIMFFQNLPEGSNLFFLIYLGLYIEFILLAVFLKPLHPATVTTTPDKVLANDVRDAAREQVESMGAQFIAVDAQGIAGAALEFCEEDFFSKRKDIFKIHEDQ